MRHSICLEGPAWRIRPVRDEDAPFIVELRNDPALGRYLHGGAANTSQQLDWLARYYERAGDYYFVVERRDTQSPEGLIALYDLDTQTQRAEWGRWILKPQSLAAVESAWLIYRAAFEVLGLQGVYCRTVADNQAVVSFHDSCGLTDRERLTAQFQLGDETLDAIEHRLSREAWPAVGAQLERLATLTARRLRRA